MKINIEDVDVLVVGAGNAASCAALSAREAGARVAMIETAPEEARGGNSAYTGGAFRFPFTSVEQLLELSPDLAEMDLSKIDFGTYPKEQYFSDVAEWTEYRCDPVLTEILVDNSYQAGLWLRGHGVRFQPAFGRVAFKVGDTFRFWGGLACHIWGGGEELLRAQYKALEKAGVKVNYNTTCVGLLEGDGQIEGVKVRTADGVGEIRAKAVVLACGGFESSPEMRARYLGPNWDLVKVRGTRYNTGRGHQMAIEAGAAVTGHWSGAHACQWDMNAPPYGDLSIGDKFQKHNYPLGIVVNARGERFIDEGLDFHVLTYAKYGQEMVKQPGLIAWQVFDQKVTKYFRDEYRMRPVTKETADTLEELATKLAGVDPEGFLKTVREYNAAPRPDVPFDPSVHDGLKTSGLAIDKTNWANRLDSPPYEAFGVTAGITFTFGGLKISTEAEVEDASGKPIKGLFAAGEIVGGLYYHNYGAGTGLAAGAVFGRIAGASAARLARG
ncbi:FAD-dependent tricarballylate dehydrogenase TcuA [Phyllobacterium lublinensis]|uniref:FAD-dependent tricarballylate dehydrogenase TcuA n=1 Tax=Phyllobacterium lublinensis TaxID=2875708 RepID=UPI001CCBDD22|nr:FAD-dependent tricarballylate dehydrogenase TcuA [Phyllobacterium sp. 2063]MBZ9653751.1 FAD-dependent tricarballylate dehydrogenase TcuA [Phyllobacterium sp. 2063]